MTHTATHLATVTRHWDDLRAALAHRAPQTWPPAGRLADYLAALDDADRELVRAEHRAERAERTTLALGEHPAPLRLTVLDTMRSVEAALVHLADQTASAIQRPVMGMPSGDLAGWTMTAIARRAAMVREDREDPRRWRYGGGTAPLAADWLTARLLGDPGPCRPLTDVQRRRIATVAAEAAQRVEAALGMAGTRRTLDRPCPRCGGPLALQHGGTRPPVVSCRDCCWDWEGPELADLWRRLDPAA